MPMLGTARRLNERFAPAVFLLLSAAPLFAQEAERTNNANGLVGLIAVLFIAVGFYVMHRMRKRIAQERGRPSETILFNG
jgi:positive regulator of sigma E activity